AATADFPQNVRVLQPYLAQDGSWELMAVFDRSARGYRVTGLLPTESDATPLLPETCSLHAYPNPFNEAVRIAYELPKATTVRLRIVDIMGREVALLVNDAKTVGKHQATWDAKQCASGIYFACLNAEGLTRVHKLVHLK
ncbi:MAG: T9SS type A sorting domain-containing protein, partial [bacterium]